MKLKALGAGNFHKALKAHLREQVAKKERDLRARQDIRAFAWIEIEHDRRGSINVRDAMEEWVNLQIGQIGKPHQCRTIVN